MSREGKSVAWGGVEADYSVGELVEMAEIRAAGDKDLAWWIHLAKAELDARLVNEPEPIPASMVRPASSSAQNDEKAPTSPPRRGGRWRPLDGQVSLLR